MLVILIILEAQGVPPTYDQQGGPPGYSAQPQYPPQQQGQYPPQQQAYYPNQGYPAPAGYAAVNGECVWMIVRSNEHNSCDRLLSKCRRPGGCFDYEKQEKERRSRISSKHGC